MPAPSFTTIGLMSGTSADGIDVACLRTDGERHIEILGASTTPYSAALRQRLITGASSAVSLDEALSLERELTQLHAHAVHEFCEAASVDLSQVDLIGFHGHTIRHDPSIGITRQIGNGPLLAQLTRRPVVFDFRQADVAAGGEGAPLAPLYHAAIVGDRDLPAVVINLGGVANITWIGGANDERSIIAGDTGPGCGLLDALAERVLGTPFDYDGQLASRGRVDSSVVTSALTTSPFFQRPLPKSADRYDFRAIDVGQLTPPDAAATLCAITAEAIRQALERLPQRPVSTWVTGGGAKHPVLMSQLHQRLPNVRPIEALGQDGSALEAACFGWLAVRHRRGLPTSLPSTTGASRPICGGVMAELK